MSSDFGRNRGLKKTEAVLGKSLQQRFRKESFQSTLAKVQKIETLSKEISKVRSEAASVEAEVKRRKMVSSLLWMEARSQSLKSRLSRINDDLASKEKKQASFDVAVIEREIKRYKKEISDTKAKKFELPSSDRMTLQ